MSADSQLSQDDKTFGMLAHLAALAAFVVPPPFGNILGPLIVWLIKKDQSAWVDKNGKEALSFQISISIYLFISVILIFSLVGILLVPAVLLFAFVMVIIASIRTSNGEEFRYPITIRFFT